MSDTIFHLLSISQLKNQSFIDKNQLSLLKLRLVSTFSTILSDKNKIAEKNLIVSNKIFGNKNIIIFFLYKKIYISLLKNSGN